MGRLGFRFLFAYLVAYDFPLLLGYLPFLGRRLGAAYQGLWHALVPWVGANVLRLSYPITVRPNSSSDTTYNYVQVLCLAALAAAVAAVWTGLQRRRGDDRRLQEGLSIYVRFSLASIMIAYGAAKIIPSQFPPLSPSRLLEPLGHYYPMGLLWTFMGASRPYVFFCGLAELLGGLLLTTRRTALLGSLSCAAVLANVVLLNFCYDVPVKLTSLHMLAMALFLAAPHARRLFGLLVLNRPAPAVELQPLFKSRGLERGTLALRTLVVLGFTIFCLRRSLETRRLFGDLAPKTALHGVWDVERFARGAKGPEPWRRVSVDSHGGLSSMIVRDAGGQARSFRLEVDALARSAVLRPFDESGWRAVLSYREPAPGVLELSGAWDGLKIDVRLRRVHESLFPLVGRGFHWISEYPANPAAFVRYAKAIGS